MSFVGPRPEEKKLVDLYKKEIPFYKMRFLIKPGIVGWAQINYPHTASVEEVKEKTAFDFYYLKNRSFILDIIIICRAIISIFEIKTH
jgi:lipopolysaccharide/colanic/teichoic acid biosynthesis glycosyltransferase